MRKIASIILLFVVLISLFSFTVEAARIGDAFRKGFDSIEDFFKGGWKDFEKTIAFLLFFFLFFSAYLIGMKKSMGELTRPHMVFAFVAALTSALIIVITMKFDWMNLKYVAWGLLFVITLFAIYSLLGKLGMENKKLWAFIIALILTALLFWLIWALMNEGGSLDSIGGWFSGLGKKEAKVVDGLVAKDRKPAAPATTPARPGGTPGTPTPSTTPGVTPPAKPWEEVTPPGKGGNKNWWWLLLLLIPLLLLLRRKGKGRKKEEEEPEPQEGKIGLDEPKMVRNKKKAIEVIEKALKEKEELVDKIKKIGDDDPPHGIKGITLGNEEIEKDSTNLKDPEYGPFKKINELREHIKEIAQQNHNLKKYLEFVRQIEERILKVIPPDVENPPITPVKEAYKGLKIVCEEVKHLIRNKLEILLQRYDEGDHTNEINLKYEYYQLDPDEKKGMLNLRVKPGWCETRVNKIYALYGAYHNDEKKGFGYLLKELEKQIEKLKEVRNLKKIEVSSIEPSSGPVSGGTPVIIKGINLGDVIEVKIGGSDLLPDVSAGRVIITDSGIKGVTPPGSPGPADVTVKNRYNRKVMLEKGFTYAGGEEPKIRITKPSHDDEPISYKLGDPIGEVEASIEGVSDQSQYTVRWVIYEKKGDLINLGGGNPLTPTFNMDDSISKDKTNPSMLTAILLDNVGNKVMVSGAEVKDGIGIYVEEEKPKGGVMGVLKPTNSVTDDGDSPDIFIDPFENDRGEKRNV